MFGESGRVNSCLVILIVGLIIFALACIWVYLQAMRFMSGVMNEKNSKTEEAEASIVSGGLEAAYTPAWRDMS